MAGYIKKVLVFDEVAQGFALADKKISGVLKVEKAESKSVATVYITNLNRNFADGLDCVLLIGKKIFKQTSDGCRFAIGIDDIRQYDDVACLVAIVQEGARIPFAFATNNVGIRHDELAKHFVNCEQTTKYEQFICATDNYFDCQDYIDIDEIKQKSTSKFKPVDMLAGIKQSDGKSFFANAKQTLLHVFNSYPPCDELNQSMPDSFWVQVPFKNDKYFCVGVVQKEGKPKYIAYGVPGKKDKQPDDDSFAFFATKNKEVGFWIICQDATSGLAASQPYFWV